jgi:hypothetical protein
MNILTSRLFVLAVLSVAPGDLLVPNFADTPNRRQAFSEKPVERLEARVGLAFGHLKAAQLPQALAWVEEYAEPLPENLRWPVVKGYLTAAKVKAAMGQTFDALHRLNRVVDKGEGLLKARSTRMEKQALAGLIKKTTSVTRKWIAERAGMGHPSSASLEINFFVLVKTGPPPASARISMER